MSTLQNKVSLIGNLGKDPIFQIVGEEKHKKVTFSMATNQSYKTKSGEWATNTQWHSMIAWGTVAERINKTLQKGNKVAIEGKLKTNSYEKDGEKKSFVNVEVLDFLSLKDEPKQVPVTEEDSTSNAKKK